MPKIAYLAKNNVTNQEYELICDNGSIRILLCGPWSLQFSTVNPSLHHSFSHTFATIATDRFVNVSYSQWRTNHIQLTALT